MSTLSIPEELCVVIGLYTDSLYVCVRWLTHRTIIQSLIQQNIATKSKHQHSRSMIVRYDPDDRQQIFRDTLVWGGVKIYEWRYLYTRDSPVSSSEMIGNKWVSKPKMIDDGYDLYILADIQYDGERGWWCNYSDDCPACGPNAEFSGYYLYPDDYLQQSNYWKKCTKKSIPISHLSKYFTQLIRDNNNYICNICDRDITSNEWFRCQDCTSKLEDDTYDMCQHCKPNSTCIESNHNICDVKKEKKYAFYSIDEIKKDNVDVFSNHPELLVNTFRGSARTHNPKLQQLFDE